ncbi:terpene synthase family protein [Streptomyces sp. NPDC048523]|uniref:terpene synthase family protein n=1 Tax=Streptomyces sp. NPDC048523 TaxID=3365567 RepID=UPI0037121A5C
MDENAMGVRIRLAEKEDVRGGGEERVHAHLRGIQDSLTTPFVVRDNAWARDVFAASVQWMQGYRLLTGERHQWLEKCDIGALLGLTNPHAERHLLRLAGDWYVWLYAFDDGVCDEAFTGAQAWDMAHLTLRLKRSVSGFAPGDEPEENYARALFDLRCRIAEHATPAQLVRWTEAVRDYLNGQLWETMYRATGHAPALDDYITMRESASGCLSCFELLPLLNRYHLPEEVRAHPDVQQLSRSANRIIAWDNDLFSYQKEQGDHSAIANLITAVARQRRCETAAAITYARERRDDELAAFLRIEKRIVSHLGMEGKCYIANLKNWVSGSLEFHRTSRRFATAPRVVHL